MLGTEATAAVDEQTRVHVTEGLNTWPDTFRQGEFVPAVEYLRAARVRTKLIRVMETRMAAVDVYVSSGQDLAITNLTGHPSVGGFGRVRFCGPVGRKLSGGPQVADPTAIRFWFIQIP